MQEIARRSEQFSLYQKIPTAHKIGGGSEAECFFNGCFSPEERKNSEKNRFSGVLSFFEFIVIFTKYFRIIFMYKEILLFAFSVAMC